MRRLTEPVLLDSNIPMYAAGREHPLREPARRIVTADGHFEGLEGITRLDPTAYEPR